MAVVAHRLRGQFKTYEELAPLMMGIDLHSPASGGTIIDAILKAVEGQVFERAAALIQEDERFSSSGARFGPS
jgi:hypothetical protein